MDTQRQFTAEQVQAGVVEALGRPVTATPIPTQHGYANENWIVNCGDSTVLVKLTPDDGTPVEKSAAAARAHRLATEAGAPVPAELLFHPHAPAFNGATVRIYDYLEGHHPDEVITNQKISETFFSSLGTAVAQIHSVAFTHFASRVEGQPRFHTWFDYLTFRLPQITERAKRCEAFDAAFLRSATGLLIQAAEQISPFVTPRLCHRDLYMDNLLCQQDGRVVGILDFDLAEPWDCAVDMVKLRWLVFPSHPGAEETFLRSYEAATAPLPMRSDRVWVCEVLELLNVVPNALTAGQDEFAQSARARLEAII